MEENNSAFRAKSRRKRVLVNTILGILGEVILVIAGIFVPRVVISNYGSATNGIVNSVQQIITYLVLFEAGINGAAVVALYKPMADGNVSKINDICTSLSKMFKKIGLIYVASSLLLAAIYPLIAKQELYSYWEIFGFAAAVSFGCIAQAFFGSQYKIALMAAQKNGVMSLVRCFSISLYYVIIIVLSLLKINPILVYIIADVAYVIRSLLFFLACKITLPSVTFHKKPYQKEKFGQSKHALLQQICVTIALNSTTIILAIFDHMNIVSVYTVYNLVLSAVFLVSDALNQSVLTSFGNLAAENNERVREVYNEYTSLFFIMISIVVSCMGALMYSFIALYTKGVEDVNYVDILYVIPITAIGALWMIRSQQTIVLSALGKFKQMNVGAIIECVLMVGLSLAGYFIYGLAGLLIGKAIGVLFRCVEIIILNNNKSNMDSLWPTCKKVLISSVIIGLSIVLSIFALKASFFNESWLGWIVKAIIIGLFSLTLSIIALLIFNRPLLKSLLSKIKRIFVKTN